jgi:alkanesulfonate monooxygenase SsuD/methylene tetrahydromethanopterin reductase-like flavin-dependent oxidoreductase (luciferase family)
MHESEETMRIGLQIPRFTWPGGGAELGARLATIARTADDAGFASIWMMDHFFQIERVGATEEPMLEGYSALSYLAGRPGGRDWARW